MEEGLLCIDHLLCSVSNYVEQSLSPAIDSLKGTFPQDYQSYAWGERDSDKTQEMLKVKTPDVMAKASTLSTAMAAFEASGTTAPEFEGTVLATQVASRRDQVKDLITLSHLFVATYGAVYLIINSTKYT